MIQFQYQRVASLKSAVDVVNADPTSMFIAGGTNLIDLMKRGIMTPQKLVDINNLPLKGVETVKGGIRIGALALNSVVADNKMIATKFPLLSQALNAGASAQLRNMATMGGNMMQRTRCNYFYDNALPCNKREPGSGCGALEGFNRMHAVLGFSDKCIAVQPSDMSVALAALDAKVIITGAKGEVQMPFVDFHRLPGDTPEKDNNLKKGELITAIEIPDNAFAKNSAYLKIRDRASYAFALVSAAAALQLEGKTIKDARLAMGGVAHKPWRFTEAEQFLKGKTASQETFKQAADIAFTGAKGFKHNSFKLVLGPNTIVEALKTAAGIS